MLLTLLFCGLVADVFSQTSTQDGLKVITTEGIVVGAKAMDGDYIAFYGIPYAGSVSGKKRFKEAPDPDKRNVEFKADDMDVLCAQPGTHGLVGKEDCLTLNIFTKNFTTPKPVIVWLDGEEYSNTNNDTPRFSFRSLVQADLVLIALNYRLSIFGFLCLGVEEAPGNAGLKDVVKGLKWIKGNVAGFGGDPNNIILLGHGSGAAMVDLLTMSPLTHGLISKAVALSGSALSPWGVAYDPAGYAKALGAKLQYTGQTHAELAKHLANTNVDVLINEINNFTFTNNSVLFAPCVENTKLKRSFLEDDPLKLLRSGNYQKIPYIASYVNQEGTIRVEEAVHGNWLKMMQNDFQAFLPANLAFKNETVRKNISQEVRLTYFGDSPNISIDNIQDYFTYEGESLITIPIIRSIKERAVSGSQALWLLEFSFVDVNNDWPYPDIRLDGVQHGDILNFIFDIDSRPVNEVMKKSLIRRFDSFARTGKPNGRTGIVWSPYTAEKSNYLSIRKGSDDGVDDLFENPRDQSVKFWQNTLSEYYATAQQVSSAGMLLASGLSVILSLLALGMM